VIDEGKHKGWANQATWAVAAQLTNNEHARSLAQSLKMTDPSQFENFCYYLWKDKTPDGFSLTNVDWIAIADFWKEK